VQHTDRLVAAAIIGIALPLGTVPAADAHATPTIAVTPFTADSDTGPRAAKKIAKSMVTRRGWSTKQYRCLVRLWQRESGWRVHAGSTGRSYGIPQAYPGSRMASAGKEWRDDPTTQIRWGLGYIKGRYETPCRAWSHFTSHRWY
jgi:hypothetical protein